MRQHREGTAMIDFYKEHKALVIVFAVIVLGIVVAVGLDAFQISLETH
jgi:hypothetical protein